jgi:hypothetical protein
MDDSSYRLRKTKSITTARKNMFTKLVKGAIHKIRDAQGGGGVLAKESHNHTWGWGGYYSSVT